jgi:hypothetical protein
VERILLWITREMAERQKPRVVKSGAGEAGSSKGGRGGAHESTSGSGGTDNRANAGGAGGRAGTAAGGQHAAAGQETGGSDESDDGGSAGQSSDPCGDGHLEGNEECDDGTENGPGHACNAQCKRNVCGDGDQGPGEGCDDGAENGLTLLACAPDCSRIIEAKHIVVSPEMQGEKLQPNPVAHADAQCPSGFKALFGYGNERRATTIPFGNANAVDWVLRPYTYYVNTSENLIWLTRETPLLGVESGAFVGLTNPISQYTLAIISNLNPDGTLLETDNCEGWSGVDETFSTHIGLPLASDSGFLDYTVLACGYLVAFYCVEQ